MKSWMFLVCVLLLLPAGARAMTVGEAAAKLGEAVQIRAEAAALAEAGAPKAAQGRRSVAARLLGDIVDALEGDDTARQLRRRAVFHLASLRCDQGDLRDSARLQLLFARMVPSSAETAAMGQMVADCRKAWPGRAAQLGFEEVAPRALLVGGVGALVGGGALMLGGVLPARVELADDRDRGRLAGKEYADSVASLQQGATVALAVGGGLAAIGVIGTVAQSRDRARRVASAGPEVSLRLGLAYAEVRFTVP